MIKTLIRYVFISFLSLLVNVSLTIFPHEVLGLATELTRALALVVVLVMNFFAMRCYIYQVDGDTLWRQFVLYCSSALGFRLLEYGAFLIGHTWLRGDYRVVVLVISLVATGVKFFYYRGLFERRVRRRCIAPQAVGRKVLQGKTDGTADLPHPLYP